MFIFYINFGTYLFSSNRGFSKIKLKLSLYNVNLGKFMSSFFRKKVFKIKTVIIWNMII